MSLLLDSSVAAAFAAGMVAFFAPCCTGVMLPTYLAAISGKHRFHLARLSAIYVSGVAVVVLPITLGAATVASYASRWHPQLFTIGGLMMIGVSVALWRETMLPINIPQPKLSGSAASVFGLGVFSGAATACCAPVLAGAIALSATSATITGGFIIGAAYIAGMVVPLIPLALFYKGIKKKVSDPKVTLRLGSHVKQIGILRLVGVGTFSSFGILFITLALAGKSDTTPGYQRTIGNWIRQVSAHISHIPNFISLPVLLALGGIAVFAFLREGGSNNGRQENREDSTDSPPASAHDEQSPHNLSSTIQGHHG